MTLARIHDGQIIEQRSDITLGDVPEHKRGLWKPIEGDAPEYDPRVETLSGPVMQIEANRVLRVWTVLPRSPEDVSAAFTGAIREHVDSVAISRGYANGFALAGYTSSTINAWASEAQTFIAWRDSVWVYAYDQFAKVQNGEREQPSIEALLSELPAMEGPT